MWKDDGAQCVMMTGMETKLVWSAENSVTPVEVRVLMHLFVLVSVVSGTLCHIGMTCTV